MIGSIIANRVRKGWGNWLEVIDRIPRFAAIKEMPVVMPEVWSPLFVKFLHEVDAIYDGSKNYASFKTQDGTPVDALYWCDSRFIETDYFRDKIIGQPDIHKRIGDMNTLLLYS
jgi:hypothetical protein